jgi:hypothetical protein
VDADEKLTAFLVLESAICGGGEGLLDKGTRFFQNAVKGFTVSPE